MSLKILIKKHKESIRTGKKIITFTKDELDSIMNDVTRLLVELKNDKMKKNSEKLNEIINLNMDAGEW